MILFNEKLDTGIDPDSKELLEANRNGSYLETINCYGSKIPKKNKSFRTIFSNSVLEHINDIDSVLKEANRLLYDGGCLYITVPNACFKEYSVISQILKILHLNKVRKNYHERYNKFWVHFHDYKTSDWKHLFKKNNFKVKYFTRYCPKSICMINDALLPFCVLEFLTKKLINRWTLFG